MIDPILLSLIGFGVWISYSDLRQGRIKNYMVVVLIVTAILVNVFFTKAFIDFPLASIANILLGVLSAVIIWLAGLWSAADAKLFIAVNALMPVTFYANYAKSANYFPGFSILINFSLPLFFFFLFFIMVKTNWEDKKQAFIHNLKPMDLLRIIFMVSSIYCLVFIVLKFFNLRIDYFLRLVFFIFLFWLIEKKLKVKIEYFLGLIIIFALIFVPSFFSQRNLVIASILSLLVILSVYLLALATPLYSRATKIEDLSEGSILAEMVVKEGESYTKRPINFVTFLSLLNQKIGQKPVFGYNPDGLSPDDLKEIKSLHEQNQLSFKEIRVSKTLVFAPILFLGALLTYIFKGPFL